MPDLLCLKVKNPWEPQIHIKHVFSSHGDTEEILKLYFTECPRVADKTATSLGDSLQVMEMLSESKLGAYGMDFFHLGFSRSGYPIMYTVYTHGLISTCHVVGNRSSSTGFGGFHVILQSAKHQRKKWGKMMVDIG